MPHHEHLEELEWLVGEWLDQSSDSTVHATCRWSPKTRISCSAISPIHVQGQPVMTVNQRIGWDPLTKQIKSWVFDSEGGYGDALWSAQRATSGSSSRPACCPTAGSRRPRNVLTRVGPNRRDGRRPNGPWATRALPEQAEYVMVRRPPHPGQCANLIPNHCRAETRRRQP